MEAELRNFQAIVFSLFGSGITPLQSSKSHTILYAETELRNFKSQYSLCGGGTSSQRIIYVWKRNCRTSSNIIVCIWNLSDSYAKIWSARSAGPNAHVSKPSWRCCSQLCHLGVGPYWDCFSLLRSYQAWSNQLTCDKDPDIRQTSRPKTTGTKLPKGPIRRDEDDFLTLQECPRKGFSLVLRGALAGAYWHCHAHCESHVF